MTQTFSYIYGFSDEIKDTAKETLLSCFYIGKQDRGSTTTFERGYDHLNNFDKNSERFKNSKCFVIARIPDFFVISTIEKYFTEMVKPELNILNNPDVNGKYGSELLPNIWSFDEYMDKLDFYVFDIEWLNTSTRFDIEKQIKATKERDEKYGNQKPIKFNDLLEKGTDEILKIFKKNPYVLVSGEFKQKINIYSQNTKGCYLENRDTYTDIVSPYIYKQTYSHIIKKFRIREMKLIGKYKTHEYYMEYSTKRVKSKLKYPIKRVLDKSTGKYITEKKLEKLVVSERSISGWYDSFNIKYKVYYYPQHEDQKEEINFLKSHHEGNFFIDYTSTAYYLAICKTICEKYPDISKKVKIKTLTRDYKTILEYYDFPADYELLYLMGILKNTVSMGQDRSYLLEYVSDIQTAKEETLNDIFQSYLNSNDRIIKKAFEVLPTFEDLKKFQSHIEKNAIKFNMNGTEKTGKDFVFISYIDVPWAIGYINIYKDAKGDVNKVPDWLSKDWNFPIYMNQMKNQQNEQDY